VISTIGERRECVRPAPVRQHQQPRDSTLLIVPNSAPGSLSGVVVGFGILPHPIHSGTTIAELEDLVAKVAPPIEGKR
jgi:hypothetical protein